MTRAGRASAGVAAIAGLLLVTACERDNTTPAQADPPPRESAAIDAELAPAAGTPPPTPRDGLAAAILIDVSGSMKDSIRGEGRDEGKIVIARRAAIDLVDQFARYAAERPTEPVLLGLYEFSTRSGQPDCREVLKMGPPDRSKATAAIAAMQPEGGTPIGSAMIAAKRALDATGLSRRHLLVVTDGENTAGYSPDDVAAAIGRRPDAERPSVYLVAFDIDAKRFDGVRTAGGLVLAAANAKELNTTLDALLRGKILIEK